MNHICMISNQYPPYFRGGDAIACQTLSEGLINIGYNVQVIFDIYGYKYISKTKGKIPRKPYIQNKVKIFPFYSGPLTFFLTYSGLFNKNIKLEKYLSKVKPDIIHFHNFSAFGWSALKSAKQIGVPIFHTLHDFWIACPRRKESFIECSEFCFDCQIKDLKIPNFSHWNYVDFINMAICPSQYMIDTIKKKYRNLKCIKIPLSLNENNIHNFPKSVIKNFRKKYGNMNTRFGIFVGSLIERKGIYDLLMALNELNENIKIFIIGEDLINIKAYSSNKNIYSKIVYLGKVNNYIKELAFQSSDFFILPSHWENCPISLIEAMYFGLPILTTNVGGIPEIINSNAIIFNSHDISAISSGIQKIIHDESLRIKYGHASRERYLKEFSLKTHINRHNNLIRSFI